MKGDNDGTRGQLGSARWFARFHAEFCEKARGICIAKGADYSTGGEEEASTFRNFQTIEQATGGRVTTEDGLLARLSDKWTRLCILSDPRYDPAVVGETIDDLLIDFVNYLILYAGYREVKKGEAYRQLEFPTIDDPYPGKVVYLHPPDSPPHGVQRGRSCDGGVPYGHDDRRNEVKAADGIGENERSDD